MCGRFALTLPSEAVAGWFDARTMPVPVEIPRYNICPTQSVAVAVSRQGERRLTAMRWGFVPHWYAGLNDGPLLINARAKTIAEKPAFRQAVQTRRCLIPASGFYEWHRPKDTPKEPWYIHPKADDLMAFAGVWQLWCDAKGARWPTFAIVTTQAQGQIAAIHHREPVVVAPDQFGLWLGEQGRGAAGLMQAAPGGFYCLYRVSARVNSARNDRADLLQPFGVRDPR
jgi:putative SOS response-associated peptidase YedK